MEKSIYEIMNFRSKVMYQIREFFNQNNFSEADVPILSRKVIPEATIELFKTAQVSPYNETEDFFLLPSPEYYLKKLISQGSGDIFSISKSFRNSEQSGSTHNPEFTMLEYYAMGTDYKGSIKITENLFAKLLESRNIPELEPPFIKMSMTEVFHRFTGLDISRHCTGMLDPYEEKLQLTELSSSLGLNSSINDSWEELFNLVFVHQVEPNIPTDKPFIIYDYPAAIPALAKQAKTKGRLERWELYVKGLELANCYSEETDYNKVKNFFEQESKHKKDSLISVKEDMQWCEMYKKSFPVCSGTAMGIERLLMLLSGKKSIEGVILFPLSDIN